MVIAEACEVIGIKGAGVEPMRLGTNALYRVPEVGLVIRISLSPDGWATAQKEIRVARWLQRHDVPAATPADGVEQPLRAGGLPVTIWQWLREEAEPPTLADLGRILRRLHEADPEGIELIALDPLAPARRDLAAHPDYERSVVDYLSDEVDRLSAAYREIGFSLPIGPVHGDAHTGNLLRSRGQVFLIDLETFAIGPREWDLVPTAVRHERFGLSADHYLSFSRAYGFDVRSWPGYPVLRRIREVVVTSWLLRRAGTDPTAASELRRRTAALRGSPSSGEWRAF